MDVPKLPTWRRERSEGNQPMADVNRGNRPLSPFMLGKYYRFQLTSVTSILTRITGNALILGTLLVVWWLLAAATGPDYFAVANAVITSWFGDIVLLGSVWALWYHALAGLRHLYWDSGRGLDIPTAERLGIGVIAGSVLLTIVTALIV
jgi:succinate dehydrogenase / fumarate reductase cytochrome b subunit